MSVPISLIFGNVRSLFMLIAGAGLFVVVGAAQEPVVQGRAVPRELRVLTYNVLADPVAPDARLAAISSILEESRADIIALQEVASWFARGLLREPWTTGYHRAQRDGRTIIAHEFIILSRFPVVAFHTAPLPGAQYRVLHAVTVDLAGVPTVIATCHLESLLEDGPMRATQLDHFFAHLDPAPEAIFLGDFNFGDGEQPETGRLPEAFRDVWLAVRPGEAGYTWGIERSVMARRESFPGEGSRRLDRILVKSSHWSPVSATIVGDAPLATGGGKDFPSDHFGLLAVLRRTEPPVAEISPELDAVP